MASRSQRKNPSSQGAMEKGGRGRRWVAERRSPFRSSWCALRIPPIERGCKVSFTLEDYNCHGVLSLSLSPSPPLSCHRGTDRGGKEKRKQSGEEEGVEVVVGGGGVVVVVVVEEEEEEAAAAAAEAEGRRRKGERTASTLAMSWN